MDITIIIPAYNRVWSLPRAIESCKSIAGLNIQVIVVDDGSNDGTWDLLLGTCDIEIFRQQNWGKPWAVNMAFSHAQGKYVKFLDSDDWLIPGAIGRQFELAERENADLVVSGYQIYADDRLTKTQDWTNCDDFIAQNLGECDSSHYSAFLFRKDFIQDIPHRTSFAAADFASRDDRCFMLEAALKEPRIAIYNAPALCHVHHSKGRLQFQKSMASVCTNYQHVLIYKNILRQLAETGRLTERRKNAAINVLWPLCHWIAKTNIKEASELLGFIRTLNPAFKIPDSGAVGMMYRAIGFVPVEKLLRLRRLVKYG